MRKDTVQTVQRNQRDANSADKELQELSPRSRFDLWETAIVEIVKLGDGECLKMTRLRLLLAAESVLKVPSSRSCLVCTAHS